MRLYHGSLSIVEHPEIREPKRTLDYGSGFYTTTSFEQAERWVRRKLQENAEGVGYINVYEFDLQAMNSLRVLQFPEPTEDWLDFVMANRLQDGYVHDFDIVCGPVANDRVYAAFALYEGGVISKTALIAELRTYTLVDQYLFHTRKALEAIAFVEAKEVER